MNLKEIVKNKKEESQIKEADNYFKNCNELGKLLFVILLRRPNLDKLLPVIYNQRFKNGLPEKKLKALEKIKALPKEFQSILLKD